MRDEIQAGAVIHCLTLETLPISLCCMNVSFIAPEFVIRTERESIQSVCWGPSKSTLLSSTFEAPIASSISNKSNTSTTASKDLPSNQKLEHSGGKDLSLKDTNDIPEWRLPPPVVSVRPASATKGIFDDSDDEISCEKIQTSTDTLGIGGSYGVQQNLTSGRTDRLVFLGGSNGTLAVYDGLDGRLVERIKNSHAGRPIIGLTQLGLVFLPKEGQEAVRTLHCVIASHGRDGNIRVWKLGSSQHSQTAKLPLKLTLLAGPLKVSEDSFCKCTYLPQLELGASSPRRGQISIWSYGSLIRHCTSSNITQSNPIAEHTESYSEFKELCAIEYDAEKLGMAMTLQLLENPGISYDGNNKLILLAGFEDGSISLWRITLTELLEPVSGPFGIIQPPTPAFPLSGSIITSLNAFPSSPVLGMSISPLSTILLHQSSQASLSHFKRKFVGCVVGAEETIVAFGIKFAPESSIPDVELTKLVEFKCNGAGFHDVKIRRDGLLITGGWDKNIRLFLLDVPSKIDDSAPQDFPHMQIQPLSILQYHTSTINQLAITDEMLSSSDSYLYNEDFQYGYIDLTSYFKSSNHHIDDEIIPHISQSSQHPVATRTKDPLPEVPEVDNWLLSSSSDQNVAVWRVY